MYKYESQGFRFEGRFHLQSPFSGVIRSLHQKRSMYVHVIVASFNCIPVSYTSFISWALLIFLTLTREVLFSFSYASILNMAEPICKTYTSILSDSFPVTQIETQFQIPSSSDDSTRILVKPRIRLVEY